MSATTAITTMPEAFAELERWCAQAGLPFDAAWAGPLERLQAVLARVQVTTNLVGDPGPRALCEHVVEALAMAAATRAALGHAPARAVDVGAGAGLEALTLALCWPQAQVVAVEPRTKRAAFIALAAEAMPLRNVQVVQKNLASAGLRAEHGLATARAVWPAPEWLPRAAPLLAPGGVIGVHGKGPATALATSLALPGFAVAAVRDVPGGRGNAVAVLRPSAL